MRNMFVGTVLGAVLAALFCGGWQSQPLAYGQVARSAANGFASETVVSTLAIGDAGQRVIIFDKDQSTLAVYEVDMTTGRIALRSVRQVRWDMALEDFNSLPPKPAEVRAMMGKE